MKKFIVITSIFNPTKAVKAFSKMEENNLVVVGDQKTPKDWGWHGVKYLSVVDQEDSAYKLSKVLPYNHYCRKMLGYLYAIENGAECIIDTDDDNIPKKNWNFPNFEDNFSCLPTNLGFVNIYELFTKQKIWPRGLPLDMISKKINTKILKNRQCRVGVWQGLADKDPDVDAVYRLTSDEPCVFDRRPPVVLANGTFCPFNTQNTIIRKELFPLMYLPTYVTFRFTDIMRGLVAQPIMSLYNFQLGFTDATVIQERNPHNYMKDFISEIPMYRHAEEVIEIVSGVINKSNSIEDNLLLAYQALLVAGIVTDPEIITLKAWLSDVKKLCKK